MNQLEIQFDPLEDLPELVEPMFVSVPILRGFTEIQEIFEIAQYHNAIIAGGYARYMCAPRRNTPLPNDVDLFPKTEESFDDLKEYFLGLGFTEAHENEISLTLGNPVDPAITKWKYVPAVQLIKPMIDGAIVTLGTTEEILSNFDFTVVRAAVISETECLVDVDFLENEGNHYLQLKNIHCPISSTHRAMKYVKKGYFMRPIETLKLFVDWMNRTPEYREEIIELFSKSEMRDITEEEIDRLEALMRID